MRGAWPSEVSWWPTYVDELHGDRRCSHSLIHRTKTGTKSAERSARKGARPSTAFFIPICTDVGHFRPQALAMARGPRQVGAGALRGWGAHTRTLTHEDKGGVDRIKWPDNFHSALHDTSECELWAADNNSSNKFLPFLSIYGCFAFCQRDFHRWQ